MSSNSHLTRASEVWYPLPFGASADVAGYIDGLFEDEIRGWVVDVAQPDRFLTLCIRINEVFAGKVTACLYREDLVPLFQSRGLHGFAFRVPEVFFAQTTWSLEVQLEDGRYLPPRPLQITDAVHTGRAPRPAAFRCLLFIHIPKTAGTALWSALRQQTGLSRYLVLYPDAPGFPGEYVFCLTESQLSNLEFVYGHFGFRLHRCMPQPCEYASVLREPISRCLSHFHQIKRYAKPGDPVGSMTGDEFLSQTTDTGFDNLMTRLISGETADILPFGCVTEAVFQHAVDNLHNWFCYAGLQERIDDVQRQIATHLGLPTMNVEPEHVGQPTGAPSVASATLETITALNEYDIRLYEYVRTQFWLTGKNGWVRDRAAAP